MASLKSGECAGSLLKHEYPSLSAVSEGLRRRFGDMDVCNPREAGEVLAAERHNLLLINAGPAECSLRGFNVRGESAVHATDLAAMGGTGRHCVVYGLADTPDARAFLLDEAAWIRDHCDGLTLLQGGAAGLRREGLGLTDACRSRLDAR
jgi:hypothetical protein